MEPNIRQSNDVQAIFDRIFTYADGGEAVGIISGIPTNGRSQEEMIEFLKRMVFQYGSAVTTNADKKSFFVTRGGYMGLASNPVVEGDEICIVAGCNVPLVIREEGGHHLLVGECFVWGLMDGEFGEKVMGMAEGNMWKTFRLR